jgi:hypothetical protein
MHLLNVCDEHLHEPLLYISQTEILGRLGTASSVAVQSARHGALTGFPDLGSARLRQ